MRKHGRLLAVVSALLALVLCAGLLSVFALADTASVQALPPITPPPPDEPGEEPEETAEPEDPVIWTRPPDCPPEDPYTPGDLTKDGRVGYEDIAFMLRYIVGLDTSATTAKLSDLTETGSLMTIIESDDGMSAVPMIGGGGDRKLNIWDVLQALYCIEHELPIMSVREVVDCKPVIYLYPTETTDVTVTLGRPDALTCVYPAYESGWRVTAQPDGTLTGTTGREYYSLYYEANITTPYDEEPDGFVVARDDIAGFLEEKLAILGLSEREAEEMIIYWLPRMQQSEYVFVRFAPQEAIDAAMPLDISPAPDTVIRVLMQWKGLDAYEEVPEQTLTPAARGGFTAVEWGGSELS